MGAPLQLAGGQFGQLTAIRPTDIRSGTNVIWLCRCECGRETQVSATALVRGHTRSCGCLRREASAKNGINGGMAVAAAWANWQVGEMPPARFTIPAGHFFTPTQQRNWQCEIDRVRAFEARRASEWLAQRGQRGERVA